MRQIPNEGGNSSSNERNREGRSRIEVEDLRAGADFAGVEIVRILDPEHR